MKKIIALILALVMLGSVSAFATNFDVRVDDANYTDTATSINTPKTELWLQVDATGQIDVTVPLVLVFQTNIDGGEANTADSYAITNNSTSDLVVTSIATEVVAEDAAANPMNLVATATGDYADDTYSVIFNVDGLTTSMGQAIAAYKLDLVTIENTAAEKAANEGGLFLLQKAVNGSATPTKIDVTMKTGALSFITKRTADDSAIDDTKGLKLLTVTYTVAINTSNALGETITTA